ncbi:hypothetical protein MRB53_016672 [Persea americana]|uniref:Uncharacterized protein n=1 Tax=Persea americana TaxID=3435 RepID=A0ACC2M3I7_PERAE|nr:hypothetical protein MRB53_016672 [Persea americana]
MGLGDPDCFDFEDEVDMDIDASLMEAHIAELEEKKNRLKENNSLLRKVTEKLVEKRKKQDDTQILTASGDQTVNNPEVGPVQLKGHEGEVIAIDWSWAGARQH